MTSTHYTAESLLARALEVYNDEHDCFGFASAVLGVPREGFVQTLIDRTGFKQVALVSSHQVLATHNLVVGDVLFFMPYPETVYKTHVAFYAGAGMLLSKWGMEPGLIRDTHQVHADHYEPWKTVVLRQLE